MPPSATPRLRIADVAVWYGTRSGGIRTYLDAKANVALGYGAFEHHLVVPAAHEQHADGRHELPGVMVGRANGYRMPLDARPLLPGVPHLGSGPTVQLWPHRHGTDAMFLGLLRRPGA